MGTRSWSESLEKYSIGETVFVKAEYFDSGVDKYSDFFKNTGENLLEAVIHSVHKSSLRVKFHIDDSFSSIKYHKIVKITDQNKHLIYSSKSSNKSLLLSFIFVIPSLCII